MLHLLRSGDGCGKQKLLTFITIRRELKKRLIHQRGDLKHLLSWLVDFIDKKLVGYTQHQWRFEAVEKSIYLQNDL